MANITPITVVITDANGNPQSIAVPPPYLSPVQINLSSGFPLQLVAGVAGQIVRCYRLFLVVGGVTTLSFVDGFATLYPQIAVNEPNEIVTLDPQLFPWFQGSLGNAFSLNSSANVQLTGAAWVNLNPT